MNRTRWLMLAALFLTGCSAIPKTQNMVPAISGEAKPRFESCLLMGDVRGGSTEEGIGAGRFHAALQEALRRANLFDSAAPEAQGYRLDMLIMGQEQPSFGMNFTVRLGVRYTLVRTSGGDPVWEKEIFSDHTETCCGTPIGVVRARKASEGAARANIRMLLDELGALKLD